MPNDDRVIESASEAAESKVPALETGAPQDAGAPSQTLEAGPDTVALQDPAVLLAGLTAERDQLAKERDEYYDLLLRRSAEFENYRRRVERERRELLEFAGMEAVRELLPVLDDFERALKTESADANYAKGVELIYQRMLETLKKLGLEPISCRGEKFNPHLHEAVEMTPSEEVEDHTILEEYRRGYNFRGRLLRPAMVRVAVKP